MVAGGSMTMAVGPAVGHAWTIDVTLAGPVALLAAVLVSVAAGILVSGLQRRRGAQLPRLVPPVLRPVAPGF
jgi:hypothetical protein